MKREKLLDLNEVLQHPGRKIRYDIQTDLSEDREVDLVRPLEGYIDAYSTGNVLLIKGIFAIKCILECARCATPLEVEFEVEVDEQFPVEGTPGCYGAADYARVLMEEEPYPLFQGNSLIVDALLHQVVLLNIPLQPLCSYGWEGDCPLARKRGNILKSDLHRTEFSKLKSLLDGSSPTTEEPAE
jgi:uncharacterized protein